MKQIGNPSFFLLIFSAILFSGCRGGSSGEKEQTNHQSDVKEMQYEVQGKKLYKTYCMNCHQSDGSGLANLYPPLAGADYLLENLPRAACMIKNGGVEEIVVNGKTYNQMMPGNPSLTPLEIAEILTYITNSWGNNKGISNVKDVEKWLKKCEE